MAVKPIPDGMESVVPMLAFKDAAQAIAFYEQVFGAKEIMRLAEPGGKIGHAEIRIGQALVMLADEYPEHNTTPERLGGVGAILHLYVADVDAVFARALAAGATQIRPPQDEFYGDRAGKFKDPFGYIWMVSTHIKDVSPEEMDRMMKEWAGQENG